MAEDFTEDVIRLKQFESQTVDEEYITVEGTVVRLFENDHDAIRQVGLLRDPTGITKFISWESSDTMEVETDMTYLFKNVSVNYTDDGDAEIAFRSKTSVSKQFSGTREQFLKQMTPEEKNKTPDFDAWPVSLDEVVTDNVRVIENGLDEATIPWDTSFFEYLESEFGGYSSKTRIDKYSEDSVVMQRKYTLPYDIHKGSVETLQQYRTLLESPYFESESTRMYSSRPLARVGECTMCGHLFDVREELDYDPVEDAPGNYINWWYGGNGTETNEDFARLDCPSCDAEHEWHEEYEYGSSPIRVPQVSKNVTLEFTIDFEPVNNMSELVDAVSQSVETDFTVRHRTYTILSKICKTLNSHLNSEEFFTIESSGDPDARGIKRHYIKCKMNGVLLKNGLERLNNIFELEDESLCRVEEYHSHNSLEVTSLANSFYYPAESEKWY